MSEETLEVQMIQHLSSLLKEINEIANDLVGYAHNAESLEMVKKIQELSE